MYYHIIILFGIEYCVSVLSIVKSIIFFARCSERSYDPGKFHQRGT